MVRADEAAALAAADRLAALCAAVLDPELRAVVLHGSLAAGGFRPGRSDIDLLAVVEGRVADVQAAALETGVREADAGTADGIDLHVVTTDVAAAPTREPALELHLGRYSGEMEVERHVASPDLLAELSMARADGRALTGGPPSHVIAPVPHDWVVDRGRHWLLTWRSLTDDADNAAFMVLTTCRMWRFALEHRHCAKAEAGEWALRRDPSLAVVGQAMRQYVSDPAVEIDEGGIRSLLDRVLRETSPRQDAP